MGRLREAQYLADTIAHKVAQLTSEREQLRSELAARTLSDIRRDKEHVKLCRGGVLQCSAAEQRALRLERMLLVR